MNPYVFIVGCPRSGTTLLQRIVSAHPLIAILHELHWVPAFFHQGLGLTAEGLVTPDIKSPLLNHTKFHKLKISEDDLEHLLRASGPTSYSAFVTALFDLYGARSSKPFLGEKTPNYVRDIPTLHGLWPRARFIHLIRDGRDVYLSVKKWTTKEGVAQVRKLAERFPAWQEDPYGRLSALLGMARPSWTRIGRFARGRSLLRNPLREPCC